MKPFKILIKLFYFVPRENPTIKFECTVWTSGWEVWKVYLKSSIYRCGHLGGPSLITSIVPVKKLWTNLASFAYHGILTALP